MLIVEYLTLKLGAERAKKQLGARSRSERILEALGKDERALPGFLENTHLEKAQLQEVAPKLSQKQIIRALTAGRLTPAACKVLADKMDTADFHAVAVNKNLDDDALWAFLAYGLNGPDASGQPLESPKHRTAVSSVLDNPNSTRSMFQAALEVIKPLSGQMSANERVLLVLISAYKNMPQDLIWGFRLDSLSMRVLSEIRGGRESTLYTHYYKNNLQALKATTFGEFVTQDELIRNHPSQDMFEAFLAEDWQGTIDELVETVNALDSDRFYLGRVTL